jgi:hypothetical protein
MIYLFKFVNIEYIMLSFKDYFLVNESPTGIMYGNRHMDMEDSAITFILSYYEVDRERFFDAYVFQTVNRKLPVLYHTDKTFKVIDAPENSGKKEIYHENMAAIFNLDMGLGAEDDFVRGRLWVDPKNKSRMLVSMWTYKEDFESVYRSFFEKLTKSVIPNANEFVYEHFLSNSKGINFAPNDKEKVEQTQVDKWKKEKAELLAQYHVVTGVEKNIVKLKIQDLNKKLGIKEDPFEFMKVTKPNSKPSWMRREGD